MGAFSRQHCSGGSLLFGHEGGEVFGRGWSWCRCFVGGSLVMIWRPRAGSYMAHVKIRAKALRFGANNSDACGCHYPLLGGALLRVSSS
jgi:hypothetical protein